MKAVITPSVYAAAKEAINYIVLTSQAGCKYDQIRITNVARNMARKHFVSLSSVMEALQAMSNTHIVDVNTGELVN